MKLKITRNTVQPSLRRKVQRLKNKRSIYSAMAQFGVQETKRAFNEPSLRPEPWAPLKNGKPARLRKNNLLARSPRVVRITQSGATIGTDRPYAAYHQQGTKAIPRRAFFPFHKNGRATKRFIRRLKPVIIKRLGI